MQITFENILWIIAVLSVAGLIVYSIYAQAPRLIMNKDFTIVEIHAFSGGRVFLTIKNTGNVPITNVWVNGYSMDTEKGGGISINSGESLALYRFGVGGCPAVGRKWTLQIKVQFQDGDQKTKVVQVVVEPW